MDPAQPIRAHYSPGPGQVLLGWACDPRHNATQPWTFARTTGSGVGGWLSVSLWWTWSWEDISSQMLGATTWGICLKMEPTRGKKNQNMEEKSNIHWLTFGTGIQLYLKLSLCLTFWFHEPFITLFCLSYSELGFCHLQLGEFSLTHLPCSCLLRVDCLSLSRRLTQYHTVSKAHLFCAQYFVWALTH